MSCAHTGCDKPVFVKKTKVGALCNGHYAQYKKGKPLTNLRDYAPRELEEGHGECTEPGCDRPSWHKVGPCQTHRRRTWDNDKAKEIRDYSFQMGKECDEPGCSTPSKSGGKCAKHYRSNWGDCIYPGCNRKMYNKKTGWCSTHYIKFRKLNNKQTGQLDE